MKWTVTQECVATIRRTIVVEGETQEDAELALIEGDWVAVNEETRDIRHVENESWEKY